MGKGKLVVTSFPFPIPLPFQKLGVEGAPERARLEKRHLLLDCFPSAARKDIFM